MTKSKNGLAEQVAAIYAAYPKKVGGRKAKLAIEKALKRADYKTLLVAAETLGKLVRPYKKDAKKMGLVPYPATFFNQDRWGADSMTDLAQRFPPQQRTVMPGISSKPAKKSYFGNCTECGSSFGSRNPMPAEFICGSCMEANH
jgi:hypothetical protein